MGDTSSESINQLNHVMRDCVKSAPRKKPQVYIHYSPKEHTYPQHIVYMISDLERERYTVIEDVEYDYTEHRDVAKYFPKYLLSVLLEEKKLR